MSWLAERRRRDHCPHSQLRVIHGAEINRAPGFRRLLCLACGRYLDGPVRLAESRKNESLPGGGRR